MDTKIDLYQDYLPTSVSSADLTLIDNVIVGTSQDDKLFSTKLNDLVLALEGNDRIFGSIGNDIFVGGTGIDTADYSTLGQAITLKAAGFVDKGKFGIDRLFEIETIIGAIEKANVIDGSTGTSTTTSLNVNLSVNSLIVNGVPGLGTLPFTVINFVNVIGTSQSDSIIGDSKDNLLIAGNGDDKIFGLNGNDTVRGGAGNDVIGGGSNGRLFTTGIIDGNDVLEGDSGNDILIGGGGNDLLDGGNDVDTADYSNLSNGITLEAVGVVNKGKVGKDQILNIEEIIGAVGKANVIDGSTGTSTTTSFDINLSANSLIVNGIPGLGSVKFAVQNFVNVTGTSQSDSIVGNNTSNLLKGGRGSDKISGLGGDDTIVGVDPGSLQPGIKEIDVLTAGADADKLVIGDEKNPYYLGGGGLIGLNDYGFITDFQTGQDKIQLKNLNNYIFGKKFIAINSLLGTTTESKDFDNSQLEAAVDEIIKNNGILTKTTEESLNSSLIYSRFDIVALIPNSYSLNDIQLV